MGQTVESAKETMDGAWSAASDHVEDAAVEAKSTVADTWNEVSNTQATSAEAVKENVKSTWESAKESTQQEWQKVTDEVTKPDPNDPSTWKQDVFAAAGTAKAEAGSVIPSWESYKEANPEMEGALKPEYTTPVEPVQTAVIPPTTTTYSSQPQVPASETAKSFTTQPPAYKPLPAVAKKGLPAWAIVLLVIGALILLCVLLGVIFFSGIIRSILQGSVPLQMVISQFLV
jgi:vacuolar-type H+-ATPase subunit H